MSEFQKRIAAIRSSEKARIKKREDENAKEQARQRQFEIDSLKCSQAWEGIRPKISTIVDEIHDEIRDLDLSLSYSVDHKGVSLVVLRRGVDVIAEIKIHHQGTTVDFSGLDVQTGSQPISLAPKLPPDALTEERVKLELTHMVELVVTRLDRSLGR